MTLSSAAPTADNAPAESVCDEVSVLLLLGWPLDIQVSGLEAEGLTCACAYRMYSSCLVSVCLAFVVTIGEQCMQFM